MGAVLFGMVNLDVQSGFGAIVLPQIASTFRRSGHRYTKEKTLLASRKVINH